MSKNQVQCQKGYSLTDFFKNYGAEDQYTEALFKWRWPDGFRCPDCGADHYSLLKTRRLSNGVEKFPVKSVEKFPVKL
jgi:hypothetical protein